MSNEILQIVIQYSLIIIISAFILPLLLYWLFEKNKKGFVIWLNKYEISLLDIIFITLCLFLILFFSNFNFIFPFILTIYTLSFLSKFTTNVNISIKFEKKLFYAFIASFTVYILLQILIVVFNIYDKYSTIADYSILQLVISLTVLLGLLFKIRILDFNWRITIKSFLSIIILYLLVRISYHLVFNINAFKEITLLSYLKNFVQKLYYPSIVEEIIFRGYLLSGLIAIGLSKSKSNIIQAIIFGIVHIIGKNEITVYVILSVSFQVLMGYIFGNLYLKTKSLTPCIILHALIDTL